ncbi:MAG: sugar ABC transporter permease [Nitrososphaeria archaeon]
MNQKQFFYLFFIPTFVFLFGLGTYPLVEAAWLSLCNLDFRFPGTGKFIGLTNYVNLFLHDPRFYNDIGVTFEWLAITILGSVLVGIVLSTIINEYVRGKFKSVCLLVLIIPAMVPSVAGAFMWRLMYSPVVGIFPLLLSYVGFTTPILSDPYLALFACALVNIWQWGCLLAALVIILYEAIPKEAIEAARVFGAGGLTLYRNILYPIIKPGLVGLIFYIMVMSLRSFDYIYVMTTGGPGITTETLDLYAYWEAIQGASRVSYACTMSIIMLLITIVLMTLFWRFVWVRRT